MVQVLTKEKRYKCVKCGKFKAKKEGVFVLGDSKYCCKECCGDPAKGEHKQTKDNFCEFC